MSLIGLGSDCRSAPAERKTSASPCIFSILRFLRSKGLELGPEATVQIESATAVEDATKRIDRIAAAAAGSVALPGRRRRVPLSCDGMIHILLPYERLPRPASHFRGCGPRAASAGEGG